MEYGEKTRIQARENQQNMKPNDPENQISISQITETGKWVEGDLSNEENREEVLENFLKERIETRSSPKYDIVKINYNCDLLKNGIVLLDSPGINENHELDALTFQFVPSVVGIICVVNARQG